MAAEAIKSKRDSGCNRAKRVSGNECKTILILIRGRKILFPTAMVAETHKLDD